MKSIIITGLALIILCSTSYFLFWGGKQDAKHIEVQITRVLYGNFTASTTSQGKLIARQKQQLVSMREGLAFDNGKSVGDFLPKGSIIATMRLLEPELYKKRQELEYEILDLQIIEEQVRQSEELFKAKAISEIGLKELKVKKYKQERLIENLRKEINDDSVRTSFNGLLVDKSFHNGDRLSAGTILATIIDTGSYAVEILAGQHQISSVYIGQQVQYSGQSFQGMRKGKVLAIERSAVQSGQGGMAETEPKFTVLADIKTLPYENIYLGSQIEAEFILNEKPNTLFIPLEAVLFRNDAAIVFVSTNGIAHNRKVKTGLSNDRFIEIIEGLTPTDTIVTLGNLDLKDGDLISNVKVKGDND